MYILYHDVFSPSFLWLVVVIVTSLCTLLCLFGLYHGTSDMFSSGRSQFWIHGFLLDNFGLFLFGCW